MTLKIKDKTIIWTKLYFRQFYNKKILNYRGLIVDKGSGPGSGIFPDLDPDPGDTKRPDPDPNPQHMLFTSLPTPSLDYFNMKCITCFYVFGLT